MDRHLGIFEEALGDGPYFLGDDLSMLDIYVWMLAHWPGGGAAWLEADCPKIVRLADTVKLRPKVLIHGDRFPWRRACTNNQARRPEHQTGHGAPHERTG